MTTIHRDPRAYRRVTALCALVVLIVTSRAVSLAAPVLSWTKRPAGTGNEQVTDIAVDASGNVYVTGFTDGRGFPTTSGVYQTTIRGTVDAFVAKYNSSGTLLYSTFYGGDGDDIPRAIAVDGSGRAYVVGATRSTNLPLVHSVQGQAPKGEYSFLLVLSATGNSLVYSSYFGGTSDSPILDHQDPFTIPPQVHALDVAVGLDGAMWVTGETTSTTLPVTPRGFQTTYGGGNYDAFVMRVNPTTGAIVNFSFYGGPGIDSGRRLVRRGDQFVLGGDSYSTLNLGVLGPGGQSDAFVIGIYDSGFAYAGGKRFGGGEIENLRGLAVDSNRNVYISGETLSQDLPVTAGAGQRTHSETVGLPRRADVFVAKLNANVDTVIYSTYLGGKSMEMNGDLAVTPTGTAYATGTSFSYTGVEPGEKFPLVGSSSYPSRGNAFVTQLSSTGGFVYSALLGGSSTDNGTAISASGTNLWIGAASLSSSFPGAPAAVGNWDALLTKMTQ